MSRAKTIRSAIESKLNLSISGITITNEPRTFQNIPDNEYPHAIVLTTEEEPESLDFKQERRRVSVSVLVAIVTTPGDAAEAAREAMDLNMEAVRDAIFAEDQLDDPTIVDYARVGKSETISGPDSTIVYGELDILTEEIF